MSEKAKSTQTLPEQIDEDYNGNINPNCDIESIKHQKPVHSIITYTISGKDVENDDNGENNQTEQ